MPSLSPAVTAIMATMLTSTRNTPALPAMTMSRSRDHGTCGVTCSITYVHPSSGGIQFVAVGEVVCHVCCIGSSVSVVLWARLVNVVGGVAAGEVGGF